MHPANHVANNGYSIGSYTCRWWPWLLWGVSVALLVSVPWLEAKAVAAGFLLLLLPGWSWLEALTTEPSQILWRIVIATGISFCLTTLGTLFLAYLPGPLTYYHILGLSALLTLPALLLSLRRQPPPLQWPDRRLWLLLILVLLLAAATRLPRLGYAEFHEDEVEVASLAVRTIKGEDQALFLHRKGPVQMLLPSASWLLTDQITEGWTRMPFVLASLLGVMVVFLLACRLGGLPAGTAAGTLMALNGYSVGFGRMMQYQAIILFLATLAVACLWLLAETGSKAYLWPAALGLTVSWLAHYDALLFGPVFLYLAWRAWKQQPELRKFLLIAGILIALLLTSFYGPYVLDPQFQHTQDYLFGNRVGSQGFYNQLPVLMDLMADYSSRFYQFLLWALLMVIVIRFRPKSTGWWVAMGLGLAAAATTVLWPGLWQQGTLNLALLPWLVVGLAGWIGFRLHGSDSMLARPDGDQRSAGSQLGYEALWLWWVVPFLAYGFLVGDPRTHVYVIYPGWVMLGGLSAALLWNRWPRWRPLLLATAGLVTGLVLVYQAMIFLPTESRYVDRRATWKGSLGYSIYGSLPKVRSYFGYPKNVGWKAAGIMMAEGSLPLDFRSIGEDFSVPMWYMFETPRACYQDPLLYMVMLPLDNPDDIPESALQEIYGRLGTIYSEGKPRIALFLKGTEDKNESIELKSLVSDYDAIASPGQYVRGNQQMEPANYQFGDVIALTGFSFSQGAGPLASPTVRPGDTIFVSLRWHSTQETGDNLRAFVHFGENPVWAQHDDDPICRLPSSLWRQGDTGTGIFRLQIPADIPAGAYPVLLGLYNPDTLERLPVSGAEQNLVDGAVLLSTIDVRID